MGLELYVLNNNGDALMNCCERPCRLIYIYTQTLIILVQVARRRLLQGIFQSGTSGGRRNLQVCR